MRLQNRKKGMWQLLGEMYNCETISQNWFSCTESMDGLDELSQAAILEVPHPEPGLHWAGREIYPGPESAAPGTECHCVDLTTVQVKTWISQAWELGVKGSWSHRDDIWCLAGGCSNRIGGKDVETVSLVVAEGWIATVSLACVGVCGD